MGKNMIDNQDSCDSGGFPSMVGIRRKRSVFDLIAPVYGLFFKYQKNAYRAILQGMSAEVLQPAHLKILDVGCGTGALCAVFEERGFDVTGVDPSQKMLDIASEKPENKNIVFRNASVLERLPFTDKYFDISIASYVAHGLKPADREMMYAEMSRVTKNLVILHDYNNKRSFATSAIEWLEGGDYFNFIRVVRDELGKSFAHVRVVNVGKRAAWYICSRL
jgi:ubiquinone/menaquinone biosynthesis C-methylase UbiE